MMNSNTNTTFCVSQGKTVCLFFLSQIWSEGYTWLSCIPGWNELKVWPHQYIYRLYTGWVRCLPFWALHFQVWAVVLKAWIGIQKKSHRPEDPQTNKQTICILGKLLMAHDSSPSSSPFIWKFYDPPKRKTTMNKLYLQNPRLTPHNDHQPSPLRNVLWISKVEEATSVHL